MWWPTRRPVPSSPWRTGSEHGREAATAARAAVTVLERHADEPIVSLAPLP